MPTEELREIPSSESCSQPLSDKAKWSRKDSNFHHTLTSVALPVELLPRTLCDFGTARYSTFHANTRDGQASLRGSCQRCSDANRISGESCRSDLAARNNEVSPNG